MRSLILVALFLAGSASAATLKIDFSGSFPSFCDDATICEGFEDLLGSSYSGSFILPEQVTPSTIHDNYTRYTISSSEASFTYDSEVDSFDLNADYNLSVTVTHCNGRFADSTNDVGCYQNREMINFEIVTEDFYYWLELHGPYSGDPHWFTDGSMPSDETLTSPHIRESLWSIYTNPYYGPDAVGVTSFEYVGSTPTYLLNPITVSVIPIPASAWLFGSGLVGLGWMRRRKTA
jgi:hypothetical protein